MNPSNDANEQPQPNPDERPNTDAKMAFEPYKNDHQSLQIGELIFENQTNKVIVYGDIEIYKSEAGLEQALKLQQLFTAMVNELHDAQSKSELDDSVAKQSIVSEQTESSKKVDNPFA